MLTTQTVHLILTTKFWVHFIDGNLRFKDMLSAKIQWHEGHFPLNLEVWGMLQCPPTPHQIFESLVGTYSCLICQFSS